MNIIHIVFYKIMHVIRYQEMLNKEFKIVWTA